MRSPGPQHLTRVKVRPKNDVIDAVTKFCKQEKLFSHEKPYILHMFLMIITFTIFVQLLCSFDHHDSLSRSKIICEQHFFRCAFRQEQLLLCPQAQVLQGTRFLYVTPNGGASFCRKAFTLHSAEISLGGPLTPHPSFWRKCSKGKGTRVATWQFHVPVSHVTNFFIQAGKIILGAPVKVQQLKSTYWKGVTNIGAPQKIHTVVKPPS